MFYLSKGECVADHPIVNNKNNQLGIAHNHASPAPGEMPPVKSKEGQALEKQQQSECACTGKILRKILL